MGSWNELCAISRYPIFSGEPVIGMLLMDDIPMPFWWSGTYDDYGWYDDIKCNSGMTQHMFRYLKKNMVELEAEDDVGVDGAVTAGELYWNTLGEWIHRGRFYLKHSVFNEDGVMETKELKVERIFIKSDVWDDLLDTRISEDGESYGWMTMNGSLRKLLKGDDLNNYVRTQIYLGRWFGVSYGLNSKVGYIDIAGEYIENIISNGHHDDVVCSLLSSVFEWRWVLHILQLAGCRIVEPVHIGQSNNTDILNHVNSICMGAGNRDRAIEVDI